MCIKCDLGHPEACDTPRWGACERCGDPGYYLDVLGVALCGNTGCPNTNPLPDLNAEAIAMRQEES